MNQSQSFVIRDFKSRFMEITTVDLYLYTSY